MLSFGNIKNWIKFVEGLPCKTACRGVSRQFLLCNQLQKCTKMYHSVEKKLRRWVLITHQLHQRGDFYRKRLSISTVGNKNTRNLWKATAPFGQNITPPLVGFCYKRGDGTLARWWQLKDFFNVHPGFVGWKFNDPISTCGYFFQMGRWKTTN